LPLFNSIAQTRFLSIKSIGGGGGDSLPPSYAYANMYFIKRMNSILPHTTNVKDDFPRYGHNTQRVFISTSPTLAIQVCKIV
jgi:hypothetical protein